VCEADYRLPRNSGSLNVLELSGPVQASTGITTFKDIRGEDVE